MIYHSKSLDLEITDFEYRRDPTPSSEFIPSQTSRYIIRGYYFIMRDGVYYPTSFVEASPKKAQLEKLSNNLSERRCELKAKELVSEQSERASMDFVGYKGKLSSSEINRETALSYFFLVFCGTCFGKTFFF